MPLPQISSDIRSARCTISDRAAFLQKLQAIATNHATHIICFNADALAGRVHAEAAVAQAVRAFHERTNISNTLEMEALLYAAGSRQCSVATSLGIHEGENQVYICCSPERAEVWSALAPMFRFVQESWDTIGREKRAFLMKTYAISLEEIAAAGGDERIPDLVLERVALLQVMR
jgi:KEOPS complex subunit Cgi121